MAAVGGYGAVRETVIAHAFALMTMWTGGYGRGALLYAVQFVAHTVVTLR